MKISRVWLSKFFDAGLPDAAALAEALTFHAFEVEDTAEKNGDEILDVKVTPNRGHDCLSHRGIAKELSAILSLPLAHDPLDSREAPPQLWEATSRGSLSPKLRTDALGVWIEDPQLCKRYIAGYIRGVKVGPSPRWLQERLEAIGQKPINNIVDATNFVMFNIGQPLHAFDAGCLRFHDDTYGIGVRRARLGEKLAALDGKEYELSETMLVITDTNMGNAIGIAGIKGGMPASITEDTADIIIESANFDGASVRKTAHALKLRTDASVRFEEVISPELAAHGMRSVVDLILKLAGGEVVGFADQYPNPEEHWSVSVTAEETQKLLGTTFGEKEIEEAFTRLGFDFVSPEAVGGLTKSYMVNIPFERLDLRIPEDLVEEIGRIIGYDKVPPKPLPPAAKKPAINKNFYWSERARQFLVQKGFSEIYTSVFAEKGSRVVLNKVDGVKPYLRESLVPAMEEALEKNKRNAEMLGLPDVRLFEIGTVFNNDGEKLMLAIGIKGNKKSPKPEEVAQEMLESFAAGSGKGPTLKSPELRSDLGAIWINLSELIAQLPEPTQYETFPTSQAERYQPFSKYPFIIRDAAFWAPIDADAQELEKNIQELAGALCVKAFLFDRFEKEGRVSLAYRLVFQSFDRTLTEEEVQPLMDGVYSVLKDKGFEIR